MRVAPLTAPASSPPPPGLATLQNARSGTARSGDELRDVFQDFTAGTVFKQMFKSLRRMHDEPAYFHGGQAEKTFRNLLDERVAEDMARSHGDAIADPLFQPFLNGVPARPAANASNVANPVSTTGFATGD